MGVSHNSLSSGIVYGDGSYRPWSCTVCCDSCYWHWSGCVHDCRNRCSFCDGLSRSCQEIFGSSRGRYAHIGEYEETRVKRANGDDQIPRVSQQSFQASDSIHFRCSQNPASISSTYQNSLAPANSYLFVHSFSTMANLVQTSQHLSHRYELELTIPKAYDLLLAYRFFKSVVIYKIYYPRICLTSSVR